MKQKTAMQKVYDKVHSSISNEELIDWLVHYRVNLIEKEKEQIIDARNDALKSKYQSVINDLITYGQAAIDVKTSEQYYNETYKQD